MSATRDDNGDRKPSGQDLRRRGRFITSSFRGTILNGYSIPGYSDENKQISEFWRPSSFCTPHGPRPPQMRRQSLLKATWRLAAPWRCWHAPVVTLSPRTNLSSRSAPGCPVLPISRRLRTGPTQRPLRCSTTWKHYLQSRRTRTCRISCCRAKRCGTSSHSLSVYAINRQRLRNNGQSLWFCCNAENYETCQLQSRPARRKTAFRD